MALPPYHKVNVEVKRGGQVPREGLEAEIVAVSERKREREGGGIKRA